MISKIFGSVVMQPTSVCNANCDYCYLQHRQEKNKMSLEVSRKVAEAVIRQGSEHSIEIVWHGGEPLATGISYFKQLLQPFQKLNSTVLIRHNIKTIATLFT